ncbi:putative transmembrane protein [Syntrophobacter sp. SbD2]|nr:putative transmembrane protein [Syntrophobacter sp. SbD2]
MKIAYLILFAGLCLFTVSTAAAQDLVRMTVEPQAISIGALYNGTTLIAKGSLPADSEAIVRFMGTSCELHMKQRGKVGGIVWMNLDSITFNGAPSVCLVSSAVDFKSLEANGGASIRMLRLSGLKGSVQIEASGGGHENAFEELLKLKQKEGLYRETLGNISYESASQGQKSFLAQVPIPSRLSPGDYMVELDAVRNGEVIARAEQPVTVKLVGFPALLAGLAFGHSALYGILATIIALLAGLAIGLVFQSRGAH